MDQAMLLLRQSGRNLIRNRPPTRDAEIISTQLIVWRHEPPPIGASVLVIQRPTLGPALRNATSMSWEIFLSCGRSSLPLFLLGDLLSPSTP
jgi:hypothetical protein